MGLETGTYIGDLVVTNPTGTDPKGQGDDHLRLIKKTIRDSFAGFTGAVIVTGTDTGAANAYVITPATALPSYVAGMSVLFIPANANTGASTLNISGLGAKALRGPTGDVLLANEVDPDGYVSAVYDGTEFVMRAPTKQWIEQLAFATALPAQAGNVGKYLKTDGSAASWVYAGLSGYLLKTANYTVLIADREKLIEVSSATNTVLTLPAVATATAQFGFWVLNGGSAVTTLTPVGADTITIPTLRAGETALVWSDGVSSWRVVITNSTSLEDLLLFGDGSDGNVTVSGALTLTRDMYYSTLTLSGAAAIIPAGFRIFARTLDLTNAPAGAIAWNGVAGGSATLAAAGAAAARLTGAALAALSGGSQNGPAGQPGASTPGVAGTSTTNPLSAGGEGGDGGAGGTGTAGTGGAGGASTIGSQVIQRRLSTEFPVLATNEAASTFSKLVGGAAGAAGGSGGGAAGAAGGASGAGGAGGGAIAIFAKRIVRQVTTPAATIQSKGASGGNGGNGDGGGVTGGGGGGGGSGGGFVYLVYRSLVGVAVTGLIDVSGGNGGTGGNAGSTGAGAAGGESGQGGRVLTFDVAAGTLTELTPAASVAGAAGALTVGGAGGIAPTSRMTL